MGPIGGKRNEGRHILEEKKSKVKWLQDGERNTKLFHNSVIQNRRNSRIQKLQKMDGSSIEARRDIEDELTHHFLEILQEEDHDRGRDIEKITRLIPSSVTRENNEMLTKSVTM